MSSHLLTTSCSQSVYIKSSKMTKQSFSLVSMSFRELVRETVFQHLCMCACANYMPSFIVCSHCEASKNNVNNFAVFHATTTQLVPINWPQKMCFLHSKFSIIEPGQTTETESHVLSKAYTGMSLILHGFQFFKVLKQIACRYIPTCYLLSKFC